MRTSSCSQKNKKKKKRKKNRKNFRFLLVKLIMSKSLNWSDLKCELSPWLKEAIASQGFSKMTPVQAATIPLFLANKDVLVQSITGSGKTLSYVLPILQKHTTREEKNKLFAVILVPTKELVIQVHKVFEEFLKFTEQNIKIQTLFGGLNTVEQDLRTFKKTTPNIIISTPGRLSDLMKAQSISVSKYFQDIDYLILDEVDKLFDFVFEQDLKLIMSSLPKQKRIGLFSATLNDLDFNKVNLRNPVKIKVNSKNHELKIDYLIMEPINKLKNLISLIKNYKYKKLIVFFSTCLNVEYFYLILKKLLPELNIFSIHGKLTTTSRMKTFKKFDNNNESSILLTTDLVSRGLDVKNVDFVIQFDLPKSSETFVHRCGRTGRGDFGQVICFINEGYEEDFIDFLRIKDIELNEFDQDIQKGEDIDLRGFISSDKEIHDKSVKAYVSFINFYLKHTMKSIFRMNSLDFIGLAKMYNLLNLPKMPEIDRNVKKELIEEYNKGFDIKKLKYLNEAKEQKRIEEEKLKLEKQEKHKKRQEKKKENIAWSKSISNKEIKSERILQREKRERELDFEIHENNNEEIQSDWKDLIRQEKKQKRSEIIGSFDDL